MQKEPVNPDVCIQPTTISVVFAVHEKTSGGAGQAILQSMDSAVSSLLALGNTHSLSSAPPVYIQRVHQNTCGSVVSEQMRFIHHLHSACHTQSNKLGKAPKKSPVVGWAGVMKPPKTPIPTGIIHMKKKHLVGLYCNPWTALFRAN